VPLGSRDSQPADLLILIHTVPGLVPLGSRASQPADLSVFTGRPAWCRLVPKPLRYVLVWI
jgi:hypothetical protein